MLLAPERQEQRRHRRKHGLCSMDLGMAAGTERQHQVHDRLTRHPVVDDDGSFVTTRGITDAAAISISLQHRFAKTTETLLVLPLQCVAS